MKYSEICTLPYNKLVWSCTLKATTSTIRFWDCEIEFQRTWQKHHMCHKKINKKLPLVIEKFSQEISINFIKCVNFWSYWIWQRNCRDDCIHVNPNTITLHIPIHVVAWMLLKPMQVNHCTWQHRSLVFVLNYPLHQVDRLPAKAPLVAHHCPHFLHPSFIKTCH